jgi:hypothetical protein
LRLTETLTEFGAKLRVRAAALNIIERQQIARLLIREILVGTDTIVIRHNIPLPKSELGGNGPSIPPATPAGRNPTIIPDYLLRSGCN